MRGVRTFFGITFRCRAAVVTTGTFMNGRIWVGRQSMPAGRRVIFWQSSATTDSLPRGSRAASPQRCLKQAASCSPRTSETPTAAPSDGQFARVYHRAGEAPSTGLTEALVALGFETDRLKVGCHDCVSCACKASMSISCMSGHIAVARRKLLMCAETDPGRCVLDQQHTDWTSCRRVRRRGWTHAPLITAGWRRSRGTPTSAGSASIRRWALHRTVRRSLDREAAEGSPASPEGISSVARAGFPKTVSRVHTQSHIRFQDAQLRRPGQARSQRPRPTAGTPLIST